MGLDHNELRSCIYKLAAEKGGYLAVYARKAIVDEFLLEKFSTAVLKDRLFISNQNLDETILVRRRMNIDSKNFRPDTFSALAEIMAGNLERLDDKYPVDRYAFVDLMIDYQEKVIDGKMEFVIGIELYDLENGKEQT